MQAFDYVAAQNVDEVVSLLSQDGKQSRILAGGTDLLVQMREGRLKAERLIDIKAIPEAGELIYSPVRGLQLGAAVSCFRIAGNPAVANAYPGLIDAIALIGGVQVQGRATVGGNLGNASPAADSIPALIVHEAICEIAGPDGRRQVPVEAFCTGPGQTVLRKGEFLVKLLVPPPKPGLGAHYLRFIPRNEMDIAVAGVGAAVQLDERGDVIQSARIALGAVAPTPLFVPAAGEALAGRKVSDEAIEGAAQIARAAVRPIGDMRGSEAQRKHLAAVLTRRALRKAVERAIANLGGE